MVGRGLRAPFFGAVVLSAVAVELVHVSGVDDKRERNKA